MKKLLPLLFIIALSLNQLFGQCTPPANVSISGPGVTPVVGSPLLYAASGCTDRVAVFTISTSPGATDYEWKITGTRSYTRVSATQYSIVYENNTVKIDVTPKNANCSGNTTNLTISVSATPSKPSISQTGNELNAGVTAAEYQWYNNSTKVEGANARIYTPTQNGIYLVEAKNGNGCSAYSSNFSFVKTAIREDAIFQNFTFYPNPITTQLFVDFNKRFELSFFNLSGQETLQKTDLQGKQEIDLSSLKRGIYMMRITSDGKTAVRKLLLK